jgi:transcription termination factor NusB
MQKLEPLSSTVGPPANSKKKYFPRQKIVNKIVRRLRNGENLLLSAPRRIGKTTILKYLEENHSDDQIIKYIIVQSVNTQEEFFKHILNELLDDKEILAGIQGYLKQASSTVRRYASKIKDIKIAGSSIHLDNEPIDYYSECIKLIESFKTDKQIVIFIDEFPDTLNNILEQDGRLMAINFLQKNRDLRMKFSDKDLKFVYTGSTGLKNVVRKFDKLDLINDIKTVDVPTFSKDEAKELIQRLVIGFQNEMETFRVSNEVIEYILEKITWKLPYYMQMIVDGLFEYYEDNEKMITKQIVDIILSNIVKSKSDYFDYFENWKGRLKKAFKNQDYTFAINVLSYISKNETIKYEVFFDLSVKYEVNDSRYILDVLQHDGYISENNKQYGFNSILLKEWWFMNVAT